MSVTKTRRSWTRSLPARLTEYQLEAGNFGAKLKPSYDCYSLWWFGLFDDFEVGGEPSKHIDVYLYVKMQDLVHIEK